MPIYYFNVVDDDITDDFEGVDLADSEAARAYAIVAARGLASETVLLGHLGLSHRIDVTNESREQVTTVTFADAVDIRP